MEKILCANSKWRSVQCAFFGLLSLYFLTKSFRIGSASWLPCLIFLVLAVERCLGFIPGASFLKLDQQGFTVCHWFREARYGWSDIAEFRVITYRYLGIIPFRRIVGWRYTESSGKRTVMLRIAGALARFDRALPDTYGMKAKELALLLDRWRVDSAPSDPTQPQLQHAPWLTSSWDTSKPHA